MQIGYLLGQRHNIHKAMAEALDIEEDIVPVLEVRILDETKKSSFRVRRLTNFPIAENIDEMKSARESFLKGRSSARHDRRIENTLWKS